MNTNMTGFICFSKKLGVLGLWTKVASALEGLVSVKTYKHFGAHNTFQVSFTLVALSLGDICYPLSNCWINIMCFIGHPPHRNMLFWQCQLMKLTLMLLVANLAGTKWCKTPEK